MESLTRSLNYELPKELHFNKYAQHILENSRDDTATIALASTPTITSLDTATHHTTTSELFKNFGASIIRSIQLQAFGKSNPLDSLAPHSIPSASIPSISTSTSNNMEFELSTNNLMLDNNNFNSAMDELQKQLEYDKFMNEVWIGIVLTLVLISMIFCFCSCFLYHQFRMWKRNYRTTVTQSIDTESCKINLDLEDPVPEYTLVSGLPSYDAALELLHKNPKSCLLVHPSVFEVFNTNEKANSENSLTTTASVESTEYAETPTIIEASMPLLTDTYSDKKVSAYIVAPLPSYTEAISTATSPVSPTAPSLSRNHSLASILTLTPQISQLKNKSPTNPTTNASGTEKLLKS